MKYPSEAELAIPVDRLHELFTYDPETGLLLWKVRKWTDFPKHRDWFMFCSRFSCKEAGCVNSDGYRQVRIKANMFRTHRIIWALQTGSWPTFQVDHINHNRADNRWANLRAAPGNVNAKNMPQARNNTSGVTGVCYDTHHRNWRAQVMLNGKHVFQKNYSTKAEAASAVRAVREFHGFHPNHGRPNLNS